MGRTAEIVGRVKRNLHDLAMPNEFILDELSLAQKDIVTRTGCLEKEVEIETDSGVSFYPFAVEFGTVLQIIPPDNYNHGIQYAPIADWDKVIANANISEDSPRYMTIANGGISLYPAPAQSGDVIKLWIRLSSLDTDLRLMSDDLEIQSYWDDALEYKTTAKLCDIQDKSLWLQLYEKEIADKTSKAYRKTTKILQVNRDW